MMTTSAWSQPPAAPATGAASAMTPTQLGEHLARLVWESLSDALTDDRSLVVLGRLGALEADGTPTARASEELLIFVLWAHTRGIQQAYAGRLPRLARAALDELHRAVFEDMVASGSSREELPIFEQRIRARYAEYRRAAESSDREVGFVALRSIEGRPATRAERTDRSNAGGVSGDGDRSEDAEALATRAVAVAAPVGDFYADVELRDG